MVKPKISILFLVSIMFVATLLIGGITLAKANEGGNKNDQTETNDKSEGDHHSFQIGDYQGAPALFIDKKPEFPMFLFEQEISQRDAQVFQDAGVKLYSFIEKNSFLDLGWVGPGQQDFSTIDRVMKTFVERVPKGYALPRIHLWAPTWWLQQNPGEAAGYATDPGQNPIFKDASFSSIKWRAETGEALRRMVRHLLDGPYAKRVMGLTLSAGMYGEWHNWNAEYLPDTSEPMRVEFIRYIKEKYNNDLAQLQHAWNNNTITFDSVTIPTAAERQASEVGLFRDPANARHVADYYEAYQATVVDAIDYFAKIVKRESKGRLLTSVLYGYSPDMGYMPQEIHHRATALAHRLESVDLFTSPHTYWRRGPGEDGALRTYTESFAAHGKLFIDEADDRTHLAPPGTSFVLAKNLDESLGIVRRAFGQAVTHGTGLWYMDQSSGEWYNDPAFAAEFKRLKKWGDYSMQIPRNRASEVAVISSNQSEFFLGGKTDVTANFNEGPVVGAPQGLGELSRAGAPFDRYLIEDLVEGRVPDRYKVYILLDTLYLSEKQRNAIEQLKTKGRTLVWNWAPGYVSDQGLSLDRMQQLTGFKFNMTSSQNSTTEPPSQPQTVTEDFEGGSFEKSKYTAGFTGNYGVVTSDPDKVVSGTYSAHGTAPNTVDWFEFLYSDNNKIRLEPGATYQVNFKAKTTTNTGGHFYFLARTASGGVAQDVGVNSWTDSSGGAYNKSFTFTLKNFDDYKLIWGIYNGGGLSVDDITISKVTTQPQMATEDFESGSFEKSKYTAGYSGKYGTLTSEPDKVVSGTYSAHGTAPTTIDWFEFLYSDNNKIRLEPGATYQVNFKAKTTTNPGGYFYFLARTANGGVGRDVGVNNWTDSSGNVYNKSFTFSLKNFDDYKLIWGIYNGGGLSVDDITITKIKDAGILPLQFRLDPTKFPGETTMYGETLLDPLFTPNTAGAEVWGSSVKDNNPAVVVRNFTDWRSVYMATTPIPAPILNRIYREAGVHVYSDTYDNLEANTSWISIHAATSGMKTIRLPKPSPVYDIFNDRLIGDNIQEFQIEMHRGQTAIFVLNNPMQEHNDQK